MTTYQFQLVVRDANGAVELLHLQAADAATATAQAIRDGLHVISCSARNGLTTNSTSKTQPAQSQRLDIDVANLAFEMATLMAAGLSVADALRTLSNKEPVAHRRAALEEIYRGIREGLPLSAALERHPGRFAPLLVATVQASEQTGDLSDALLRYANHQLMVKSLKDKVVGAAIYPLLLLGVGCTVIVFLVTVVVPKFATLIESSGHALPWSSRWLLSWGHFVASHGWEFLAFILLVTTASALQLRQLARNGARSAWLDRVPVLGPTIRQFRHAQLYRTIGMLVRGGIALPRSLQLSASLLGDADRVRLNTTVQRLYEGNSLSSALRESGLSDPVADSMLNVAERTGAMAEMLERIAQFHDASLQRSVQLASRLLEPVLMVLIGLVVGAIVVLMYLPIFDLAASLQ